MAREFSAGTLRKKNGQWQGLLCWKDENGKKHQTVKLLGVKCDNTLMEGRANGVAGKAEGLGAGKAMAELKKWRDSLIASDEAEDSRIAEEKAEKARRTAIEENDPAVKSVEEYVTEYVADRVRDGSVGRSTQGTYRYIIKHIADEFGDLRADQLTPAKVEAWKKHMYENEIGQATISKAYVLLKSCMTHGYEIGQLKENPFRGVKAPKRTAPDPNALNAATVAKVSTKLDAMDDKALSLGIRIALNTGMREGEVCGLRWMDVDLRSKHIHVRNVIGRNGSDTFAKEPKTRSSRRDIPISDDLLAAFKKHRREVKADCKALNVDFDESWYVIGDMRGGWYNPAMLGKRWKMLADAEGWRGSKGRVPTYHDLRHSWATIAISQGVDVKVVAATLGHANESVTLRVYADALPEAKEAGMGKMNGVFNARAKRTRKKKTTRTVVAKELMPSQK